MYGSDFPFTSPAGVAANHQALVTSPVLEGAALRDVFRRNALQLFPRLRRGGATA